MKANQTPEPAGPPEGRPTRSQFFPWYDSVWLTKYTTAKAIVKQTRPGELTRFVEAFRIFHTSPDFEITRFDRVFDEDVLREIRRVASSLRATDLKVHEAQRFGRFIARNVPYFTELQRSLLPVVSAAVGEPVEAGYNFLSLYTSLGICPLHVDSPESKWTLDLCLNQTVRWPIHFSQVQPWPEAIDTSTPAPANWEQAIRESASLRFTPWTLEPGQAIVFSGSSQWHYRDAIPEVGGPHSCDLLFFHFIPVGTAELVQPKNWARLFGISALDVLS